MTARPSPEFRTHHDVNPPRVDGRMFRQAWEVSPRLRQLHRDGEIDTAALNAALDLRDAWEAAYGRGRSAPLIALRGGGGGLSAEHDRQLRRVEAAGELRRVRALLGSFAWTITVECAVADLPWAAIGRRIGVTDKTARGYAIAALRRLAAAGAAPLAGSGAATRRRSASAASGSGQKPDAA